MWCCKSEQTGGHDLSSCRCGCRPVAAPSPSTSENASSINIIPRIAVANPKLVAYEAGQVVWGAAPVLVSHTSIHLELQALLQRASTPSLAGRRR